MLTSNGTIRPYRSWIVDQEDGAWMPARSGVSHEFVQGLIGVRPQAANPAVSRVTTLAPRTRAIDAIIRSAVAAGRPALRRAAKISQTQRRAYPVASGAGG